jgi:hypothetical protein
LQIIYKLKNKIEEAKRVISYCTKTVIILKNNEIISFKTLPLSTEHTTNIYKYLTNVLKVKHIFPDFSYELKISEIIPNKQAIEEYINYCAEHGRKPPFYKSKHRMMLILPIIVFIIFAIFLVCVMVCEEWGVI